MNSARARNSDYVLNESRPPGGAQLPHLLADSTQPLADVIIWRVVHGHHFLSMLRLYIYLLVKCSCSVGAASRSPGEQRRQAPTRAKRWDSRLPKIPSPVQKRPIR